MTRFSICMATYNGEAYLRPQIDSILCELGPDDEVVVVDDCSRDGTVAMLEARGDPRIRLVRNNRNLGAVKSFERAILLARGDVLFLADQDDVWEPGRMTVMVDALTQAGGMLVVSNYSEIDRQGRPVTRPDAIPPLRATHLTGPLRKRLDLLRGKANYYGCAMAFTRDFAAVAAPFPDGIECHDLWLAALAIRHDGIVHLEQSTLRRRLHGSNLSLRKRPLWQKLRSRIGFARMFVAAAGRSAPAARAKRVAHH